MQNLWINNLIQWIYLESRTRGHDDDDLNSLHCVEFSSTAWKVSKYGVNLRIESKYGKLRTRKTPYLNKFCAVQNNTGFPWSTNLQSKNANFFILIVWYFRTHQQKKKNTTTVFSDPLYSRVHMGNIWVRENSYSGIF